MRNNMMSNLSVTYFHIGLNGPSGIEILDEVNDFVQVLVMDRADSRLTRRIFNRVALKCSVSRGTVAPIWDSKSEEYFTLNPPQNIEQEIRYVFDGEIIPRRKAPIKIR